MRPHEALVGKENHELRAIAPEASHQHRRGGLYLDLGIAADARTKEPYADDRGPLRAWLHIHPYDRGVLLRPVSEDDKFADIRDR